MIAYGYSQTGGLLRTSTATHANSTGGLAFDGALYGGAGGFCLDPTLVRSGFPCGDGPVSDGGKVIAFNGEGDASGSAIASAGRPPTTA